MKQQNCLSQILGRENGRSWALWLPKQPLLFWAVMEGMRVHLTLSMAGMALSSEHKLLRLGPRQFLTENKIRSWWLLLGHTFPSLLFLAPCQHSSTQMGHLIPHPAQADTSLPGEVLGALDQPLQCPGECWCQHRRGTCSICHGRRQGWGPMSAKQLELLWSLTLRHKTWCFVWISIYEQRL